MVGAGLVVNAVGSRRRLAGLGAIGPAGPPDAPAPEGDGPSGYQVLLAEGARLPDEVRRSAIVHARERGLQVLDLVPVDLPCERALDLARSFDPATYRTRATQRGCGAGFATLVQTELLERAGLKAGAYEHGDHASITIRLRQYARPLPAGFAADLAVVPCPTTPRAPAWQGRRAWLRGLGSPVGLSTAPSVIGWLAVLACLAADPRWGLLALTAYCAVPYLVFARSPLRPRDLHRSALLRPVRTPWTWWRTLTDKPSAWEERRARREREAADHYRAETAQGVAHFLGPRRDDCPWCGSTSLAPRLRTGDMLQAKPGTFTLERCRDCGHIFQNPRLTQAGLDFYYRDAYDGLGYDSAEWLLSKREFHLARAEMVKEHLTPRTWLDVGTGHGHFCRMAATTLPHTIFDGLDIGDGVREAQRRGWLRHGRQGWFTERVADLAGRYDVISMHHYLEHTPDPFAELDAAAKVLEPGGHLLIELPDPECRTARVLGRHWTGWFQPQHLHMIPIGNLEQALTARGLHVIARQRRQAAIPHELTSAAATLLPRFAPPPSRPWAPGPPTVAGRLRRVCALPLVALLMPVTVLLDHALVPFVPGPSNAYRVLARKEPG
ncbi:class I SAM-dependent methyltransferase [Spirillospora sp. CA-253888]